MAAYSNSGLKVGTKVTARATVSKTGREVAHGTNGVTRLLINVKVGGKLITDHIWVRDSASVKLLASIPVGSIVEIEGEVVAYESNPNKLSVEKYTSVKVVVAATVDSVVRLSQAEDRQNLKKYGEVTHTVLHKNGSVSRAKNAAGVLSQIKKEYS